MTPVCKKHSINHGSDEPCPDCEANATSYRGMQTPLTKVGNIHNPRVNGKPWEEPLNAPTKSVHIKQR